MFVPLQHVTVKVVMPFLSAGSNVSRTRENLIDDLVPGHDLDRQLTYIQTYNVQWKFIVCIKKVSKSKDKLKKIYFAWVGGIGQQGLAVGVLLGSAILVPGTADLQQRVTVVFLQAHKRIFAGRTTPFKKKIVEHDVKIRAAIANG